MDIVAILRDLWRMRLLVACAAVVALLAGLVVAYKPGLPPQTRKQELGEATISALVDTPRSQLVEVAPAGSDTLGLRANLIASLMVDGVVKDAIAKRAGLPPNKLSGIAASSPDQPSTTKTPANGYVLTTTVQPNPDGEQLPIIQIAAEAPDATRAAGLANAAVAGLRQYLDSQAATERVPDARRLRVTGLGAAQAHDVVRGPRNLLAFVAAIFVFLAGCGAILAFQGLVRGLRAASLRDPLGRGGARRAAPHADAGTGSSAQEFAEAAGRPAGALQGPDTAVHGGGRRHRR